MDQSTNWKTFNSNKMELDISDEFQGADLDLADISDDMCKNL